MNGLRHRFAVLVAGATFLLIVAGGLVTSTGSGLAVPDWPLSFGQVFPRMEGGVLFEHGHRMIASAVGVLVVILAVSTARTEPRRWVRKLGWLTLAAVVVQGVLGGATVLLRLPDSVSVAHAGLAQVFFALTVTMAAVTAPRFIAAAPDRAVGPAAATRTLSVVTVLAIYAQILLGAVVRHTGAGLIIPGFPLPLIPAFSNTLVLWQFLHRAWACVVVALIAWTSLRIFRHHARLPWIVRPALLLTVLAGWQFFLGALTIWTGRAVGPTTAHVATGALLFASSVLLAVRCHRVFAGPESVPAEPALAAAAS